jgi:excisionase family DNA binding protein
MPRHVESLPRNHRPAPMPTPAASRRRPRDEQSGRSNTRVCAPHVWLTVAQAAARAQCGRKSIYDATKAGRLRAARIGGRALRFRPEWVDAWLEATVSPSDVAERVESSQVAAFSGGVMPFGHCCSGAVTSTE